MPGKLEILTYVRIIGSLDIGDKIDVSSKTIQPPSLYTRLMRRLYYQDRTTTLSFISSTILRTENLIKDLECSSRGCDKYILNDLYSDLSDMVRGIDNLKQTYILDIRTCCILDSNIKRLKFMIEEKKEK